jgi:GNAT superfamily N-acetyltransferase
MGLTLEEAADCFCHGFSHTRSFTHPYEFIRVGGLRVMRDAPRTSGDTRNSEIVTIGGDPDEVCTAVRNLHPGRFFLCVLESMDADFAATKAAYKARQFRMLRSEPMFLRDCTLETKPDPRICRVMDAETAELVRLAAGKSQIQARDLEIGDVDLRLYAAFQGEKPVGWVKSIRTSQHTAWVSNLYVLPEHRRKGLGAGLMQEMLADDARNGIRWSVLLASADGTKLYPQLGYEQIGVLQMFAPVKEAWDIPRTR